MYMIPSNYDLPVSQIIRFGSILEKCIKNIITSTDLRFTYVHIFKKDIDSYVYLNTTKIEK